MMKIIFLLLLSFFVNSTKTQQWKKQMEDISASALVNVVMYFDTTKKDHDKLKSMFDYLIEAKKGYWIGHSLDCSSIQENAQTITQCKSQYKDLLPAVIFTSPPLNRINPVTKQINSIKIQRYSGTFSQKAFYNYATTHIKRKSDWSLFLNKHKSVPTIIYFTDKNNLSPFYKALTANFRNTIAFAHAFKNDSLTEQFKIRQFPAMILNGQQNIQLAKSLQEQIKILKNVQGASQQILIDQTIEQKEELKATNFEEKVLKKQSHILIHVRGNDGQNHAEWIQAQLKLAGVFQFYQGEDIAQILGVRQRPALVYFPKSLSKKQVQKTIFYSKDQFEKIISQLEMLIEDFSVTLVNDIQMQKMTSISLQQNKLVAILFHHKQIPLIYRILSNDNHYKQAITFFRMKDPQKQVIAKFKLTKFPTLMIMVLDETAKINKENKKQQKELPLKIAQFQGKYVYNDLSNFLDAFAPRASVSKSKSKIIHVETDKQWKQNCQQACYLLLVDESSQKKSRSKQIIEIVQKGADAIHQSILVIDGICHPEVLASFQIYPDEMPTFLYINSKFIKYSRLVGRIQEKIVNDFVKKVKSKKISARDYQEIKVQSKDCQVQHRKITQMQSQSAGLSQEEKKIIQEIRENEIKQKEQQKINDKKQGKKKKKNKKRPKEENSQEL